MIVTPSLSLLDGDESQCALFKMIAEDLQEKGHSLVLNALPEELVENLSFYAQNLPDSKFSRAGVGRNQDHQVNHLVRTDKIRWIKGDNEVERQWLSWAEQLQESLNRQLFLGLFSFESHFAHYGVGDFYKKHVDAFKGETNRVLSLVCYLNRDWKLADGGELKIYLSEDETVVLQVAPAFGTVVIFLSDEFPHEVLPTNKDRFSIAGWYRINTSFTNKVDPPV